MDIAYMHLPPKEIYYAKMNRPFWRSVACAFLGHDIYTARGWYFWERGCHRCGLSFLHQWELLDHPPITTREERDAASSSGGSE